MGHGERLDRSGLDEAIRLPVRVTVLPPGLTPRATWLDGVVNRATGPWELNICYVGSVESTDCRLEIWVSTPQVRDVPNTTVDGHQATASTSPEADSATLRVYDVMGLDIKVISQHGAADGVSGGLTGIVPRAGTLPQPTRLAIARRGAPPDVEAEDVEYVRRVHDPRPA